MKTKVLVVLVLLLASILVGVMPTSPARAAACLHQPSMWVSELSTYAIRVNWECPPVSSGIAGRVILHFTNGSMQGTYDEQWMLSQNGWISDPPTALIRNTPVYPAQYSYYADQQGWYSVTSVTLFAGGTEYHMTMQGMGSPVCLPNPNGC